MKARAALMAGLFALAGPADAQEQAVDFDTTVRIQYDFIHTGAFESSAGPFDFGTTDTHVFLLSAYHSFNDRWSVFGSLPYVQKRHKGEAPHNPAVDFYNYQPPDLRFVDDGRYHGGLQDLFFGVQFQALEGPAFSISPYVSYGVPVTNYPFYASAAIGRHVWQVPVGAALEYIPYFSDWEFRGDLAYVFSEKPLGVNINYWLLYASASYYVTPRFAPKVYITSRRAPHALRFPEDFTDDPTFSTYEDFDSEWYYYHDKTIRHNSTDAGVGFDYVVSARYTIAGSFYRTIIPDNVAEVDYAVTFALNCNF